MWPPGPLQPRLGAGAVDVWLAELSHADGLEELLSDAERDRAARIVAERNRLLWARSRGLLRTLIARYLDCDPLAPRFDAGAHGKPCLPDARLRFNLAHSGSLALYAFSVEQEVGVDLEMSERATLDPVALAARMLGAAQAQALNALDEPARQREFLRMWVRHEATLKCLGTGIGAGAADALASKPRWVSELDVGPGALGAVACALPPRELRRWGWASD